MPFGMLNDVERIFWLSLTPRLCLPPNDFLDHIFYQRWGVGRDFPFIKIRMVHVLSNCWKRKVFLEKSLVTKWFVLMKKGKTIINEVKINEWSGEFRMFIQESFNTFLEISQQIIKKIQKVTFQGFTVYVEPY